MRYGLYVICFVVTSHANLHTYITASNQYNYVRCWTQFLSLTVLVPSYSFSVAINRSRTHCTTSGVMTSTWSIGYYALLYIYCLLKGSIFHTRMSCGFFRNGFMYWIHVFPCYNRVCFTAHKKTSTLYSALGKMVSRKVFLFVGSKASLAYLSNSRINISRPTICTQNSKKKLCKRIGYIRPCRAN